MTAAADTLRAHLAQVAQLRQAANDAPPELQSALAGVRHVQVGRFLACYADFLTSTRHQRAARFFLTELYGAQDYSRRDAQFARIAGAIERLFPAQVMDLALRLAHVHALTENLDWELAQAWMNQPDLGDPRQADPRALAERYLRCWRAVGRPDDRAEQLATVMALGWHMAEVVRIPGLRMALRLMRRPAQAAGLSALQTVLENGFDAFTSMGEPTSFLDAVNARESDWIGRFFRQPLPDMARDLAQALEQAQALRQTV